MTVTRSFPWKTVIFLLIVAIGGVVFYDINLHGSYENSQVGKFLKSSGIQQHAQTGLKYTIVYTKKGLVWGQENIPVYYGVTKNFLAPYGELARDLFAFSANVFRDLKDYVVERIPVVTSFIESYAPGLIDKIVEGSVFIWTKLGEYFEIVRNYLATNVFVGQLSPDNLHKVTLQAINTTQVYAIQYYDWLSQKVQMLSDVK